jgi:hypothetical protein
MTTLPSASDYPVRRSARLGALGFGVGFALAWLVLGVASRQTQLISTFPQLGTVVFAGGSAFGSAALALWVLIAVTVPFLGTLAYFIVRPGNSHTGTPDSFRSERMGR